MNKLLENLLTNVTTVIEDTENDKSWNGLRDATYQSVSAELKKCNKNFTLSTLCRMSDYLDTSVPDLLTDWSDM